jgi:hypothetical protein
VGINRYTESGLNTKLTDVPLQTVTETPDGDESGSDGGGGCVVGAGVGLMVLALGAALLKRR